MKKMASLILVAVLCLALCACGGESKNELVADAFVKPDNYAMVMEVSINPQIRLYLDENGIVLAIEPVNDDAKAAIADIAYQDAGYQKVISEFIAASNSKGYVNEGTDVKFEIVENKGGKMDATSMLDKASKAAKDTAAELGVVVAVLAKPYAPGDMPDHTHSFAEANCTEPKTCKTCGATEGDATGHDWTDANCTAPKTCEICGATEGDAAGHDWENANCTEAKTCKTCGATEGDATGHDWTDANCIDAKICKVCGETEGDAIGHDWTVASCTEAKICKTCGVTEGSANGHDWTNANCTAPKTCEICGATEGDATGHDWTAASCTEAKICKICGATEGDAAGHDWENANCTEAKTCKTCGATDGDAIGHDWAEATCVMVKTCKTCGVTEGKTKEHDWQKATCTEPKTCKNCGTTNGAAKGHNWKKATCDDPKTCKTCGVTDGEANGHNYIEGKCTKCNGKQKNYKALDTGVWTAAQVVDGTLYKVELSFKDMFFSAGYGVDINSETFSSTFRDQLLADYKENKNTLTVVDGVYYFVGMGDGGPITYTTKGDTIEVNCLDYLHLTIKRTAGDQLTIVKSDMLGEPSEIVLYWSKDNK